MALFEGVNLPDILKASAPQAFALAVSCLVFLYLSKIGILPTLAAWMVLLASFVGLFAGLLWLALSGVTLWKLADPLAQYSRWQRRRVRRKAVTDYIPHMTETEREIIGCLLERNHKVFQCDIDGGHAATLIAQGIVVSGLKPGQVFDQYRVPWFIPDDVWNVLIAHRQEFPAQYQGEGDPWHVPWMAR